MRIWSGKAYAAYTCVAVRLSTSLPLTLTPHADDLAKGDEFTFFLYLPEVGTQEYWYEHIEPSALDKLMGEVTPVYVDNSGSPHVD